MNTADKSIALLDIALRRRFGFRELLPKPELLENQTIAEVNLAELLNHLNNKITEKIDKNLQIGHSYFMKKDKAIKKEEQLISRMKDEILPLLQEYCFDDFNTLAEILGSNLVNLEQGRFNQEVFSSAGKEVILTSLKSMLNGENDNGVDDKIDFTKTINKILRILLDNVKPEILSWQICQINPVP